MKRLLLFAGFIALCVYSWGYDFCTLQPKGYTLYFNIIDEESVEVTFPAESKNGYWRGFSEPSGKLEIPPIVENKGVQYAVTAIGDRAFSGCQSIKSVSFPDNIVEIGAYAFYQCSGLTGILVIGEEIQSIGRSAFSGCTGITELHFKARACEYMGGSTSSMAFSGCRSLHKITFGEEVTIIPSYAFVGMDQLNCRLYFPSSLEIIGDFAFAYCFNIKDALRFPKSLQSIGQSAFAQCHSITSVTFPKSLRIIKTRAFNRCINLNRIVATSFTPPTLENEVFSGVPVSAEYVAPCFSFEKYREANGWKNIRHLKSQNPGEIELYTSVNISGAGQVIGGKLYRMGDTATLIAVCNAGYGFAGWSDGVVDNPRMVIVNDTINYMAIMYAVDTVRDVEYVHDTTYMEGREVVYEYYEINDRATPISSQNSVVYDKKHRRIDITDNDKSLLDIALYTDAGECIMTGIPRHGRIRMRRYPTGRYIVRVRTYDSEQFLKFFHSKK